MGIKAGVITVYILHKMTIYAYFKFKKSTTKQFIDGHPPTLLETHILSIIEVTEYV